MIKIYSQAVGGVYGENIKTKPPTATPLIKFYQTPITKQQIKSDFDIILDKEMKKLHIDTSI